MCVHPRARRDRWRRCFDAGLQQVLGNARELAAGSGGDEHVHQLRIGFRRPADPVA